MIIISENSSTNLLGPQGRPKSKGYKLPKTYNYLTRAKPKDALQTLLYFFKSVNQDDLP